MKNLIDLLKIQGNNVAISLSIFYAAVSLCALIQYFQKVLTSLLLLGGNNITVYNENYFYNKLLGYESRKSMLSAIDKDSAYKSFELIINGKNRKIDAVKTKSVIYKLQKNLLDKFLLDIPLPNCVCGFVKGKSYLDFLEQHCSKDYYLRLDIKDFFHSLKAFKVKEVMDEYIHVSDIHKKKEILDDIVNIVTLNGSLPQGAITSPQVSNILFRRLDIRIRNYCRKFNVDYTRYADDMLFSSNDKRLHEKFFVKMISKILRENQLKVNVKKLRKSLGRLVLNGYVIDREISLSRNKLKNVNALLYAFENFNGERNYPKCFQEFNDRVSRIQGVSPELTEDIDLNRNIIINYLAGYRSYLLSFSKERYKEVCFDYSKKVRKIEFVLDKLTSLKLK